MVHGSSSNLVQEVATQGNPLHDRLQCRQLPLASIAASLVVAVLGDSLSVSPSREASFPVVLQRKLEAEGCSGGWSTPAATAIPLRRDSPVKRTGDT